MGTDARQYETYKYVISDLTGVSCGAGSSYAELLNDEEISFKFQVIIRRFFLTEVEPDTTLESHLYYLEKGSLSYHVYSRLKAKVRFMLYKQNSVRRGEPVFSEKTLSIEDFCSISPQSKGKMGIVICEVRISKMALAGLSF